MVLLFFSIPRPPCSALFPYTTLFRSRLVTEVVVGIKAAQRIRRRAGIQVDQPAIIASHQRESIRPGEQMIAHAAPKRRRSEEHTSELQSHSDLVCRLLLENKKRTHIH